MISSLFLYLIDTEVSVVRLEVYQQPFVHVGKLKERYPSILQLLESEAISLAFLTITCSKLV